MRYLNAVSEPPDAEKMCSGAWVEADMPVEGVPHTYAYIVLGYFPGHGG